jgi:hypothetical protein
MSFLSKFGKVALNVLRYTLIGGEVIRANAPSGSKAGVVVDKILEMGNATLVIEAAFAAAFAGQKTGPQKLEALIPQISVIVLNSQLVVGKKIAIPELFAKGLREYAQGTADILNSLSDESISEKETDKVKPEDLA